MSNPVNVTHPQADVNANADAAATEDQAARLWVAVADAINQQRPSVTLALGVLLGTFRDLAVAHGLEKGALIALHRTAAAMQHELALRHEAVADGSAGRSGSQAGMH